MNDPHELTIRVQALDGQWETLGADRYLGVYPENVNFTHNQWGPDTLSFVLRRNVGAIHPDLTTWTPIEVEVAGAVTWDGRLKETPTAEGEDPTISVQAEGWQYHLDDDVYSRNYVHSRLDGWTDSRSLPTADLNVNRAVYEVQVGDGIITLGYPAGASLTAGTGCSVTLDLGPDCYADEILIEVASSYNSSTWQLFIMCTDTPWWNDASRYDFHSGLTGNTSPWLGVNQPTIIGPTFRTTAGNSRYLHILGWNPSFTGFTGTAPADTWFRITRFWSSANIGDLYGGGSALTVASIVSDALAHTVFLSDTSQVDGTGDGFFVPDFHLDGPHTPREVINAANAYRNWETRVVPGKMLRYAARSVAPDYEIGTWSGAEFSDASANSGEEIYNRVLVQGTGPDNAALTSERWTQGLTAAGVVQPSNPSATVNTAGWTVTSGSLIRAVGQYHTAPASFAALSAGTSMTTTVAHTMIKGQRYRASMWALETDTVLLGGYYELGVIINGMEIATFKGSTNPTGVWGQVFVDFTVPITTSSYTLRVLNYYSGTSYVDDILVERQAATLIDRRSFVRSKILPISSAITKPAADRIGDLYLAAHKTVPFRGSFRAVGRGGVRRTLGGQSVHPAHIVPGAVVRCSHRIDPDTGGWGRDGRIASVAYDHDSLTANVSLDDDRGGFETLLSRLAVVSGQ